MQYAAIWSVNASSIQVSAFRMLDVRDYLVAQATLNGSINSNGHCNITSLRGVLHGLLSPSRNLYGNSWQR